MGETQTRKKSKGKNKSVMHPFLFFLWAHGPGRKFAKRVASWWSRIFPRNPTPPKMLAVLCKADSAQRVRKQSLVQFHSARTPFLPFRTISPGISQYTDYRARRKAQLRRFWLIFFFNLTSVCCWGYWILSMRVYMICNQIHSFPPSAW